MAEVEKEGEEVEKGDEKRVTHSERRRKIREEIISTEESYVRNLKALTDIYCDAITKEQNNVGKYDMKPEEFGHLLSNITTIANLNTDFLSELKRVEAVEVAKVLNRYADLFKMYTLYLNGYEPCLAALDKLSKCKKGKALLEDIQHQLQKQGGQTLQSYLIMPVQRIPRYVLLLKDLIESSSENHPQYKEMTEAKEKMERLAHHINDQKRQMEQHQKLAEVASRVSGVPKEFQIILPHRRLVKEGPLVVTMSSGKGLKSSLKVSQRIAFLFSDILLLTKGSDKKLSWKGSLSLTSATVETPDNGESFTVTTLTVFMAFKCINVEDRVQWVEAINTQIHRLKKIKEAKTARTAMTRGRMLSKTGEKGAVHSAISRELAKLSLTKSDSMRLSGLETSTTNHKRTSVSMSMSGVEDGDSQGPGLLSNHVNEEDPEDHEEEHQHPDGHTHSDEEASHHDHSNHHSMASHGGHGSNNSHEHDPHLSVAASSAAATASSAHLSSPTSPTSPAVLSSPSAVLSSGSPQDGNHDDHGHGEQDDHGANPTEKTGGRSLLRARTTGVVHLHRGTSQSRIPVHKNSAGDKHHPPPASSSGSRVETPLPRVALLPNPHATNPHTDDHHHHPHGLKKNLTLPSAFRSFSTKGSKKKETH